MRSVSSTRPLRSPSPTSEPESPTHSLPTDRFEQARQHRFYDMPELHYAVLCHVPNVIERINTATRAQLQEADTQGNTVLHLAVLQGDMAVIEKLLRTPGVQHTRNQHQQMPLHLAIAHLSNPNIYQNEHQRRTFSEIIQSLINDISYHPTAADFQQLNTLAHTLRSFEGWASTFESHWFSREEPIDMWDALQAAWRFVFND